MDSGRISGLAAFAGLPAAKLDELAAVMNVVEMGAGTELITSEKDGLLIYFVEEGEAGVLDEDGEVVHVLGPGDTFGEIAILVTGRRTATVVARTDMVLFGLFDFEFEQIRERVPEFERSIRRLGSERLGSERLGA